MVDLTDRIEHRRPSGRRAPGTSAVIGGHPAGRNSGHRRRPLGDRYRVRAGPVRPARPGPTHRGRAADRPVRRTTWPGSPWSACCSCGCVCARGRRRARRRAPAADGEPVGRGCGSAATAAWIVAHDVRPDRRAGRRAAGTTPDPAARRDRHRPGPRRTRDALGRAGRSPCSAPDCSGPVATGGAVLLATAALLPSALTGHAGHHDSPRPRRRHARRAPRGGRDLGGRPARAGHPPAAIPRATPGRGAAGSARPRCSASSRSGCPASWKAL